MAKKSRYIGGLGRMVLGTSPTGSGWVCVNEYGDNGKQRPTRNPARGAGWWCEIRRNQSAPEWFQVKMYANGYVRGRANYWLGHNGMRWAGGKARYDLELEMPEVFREVSRLIDTWFDAGADGEPVIAIENDGDIVPPSATLPVGGML